MIRKTLIAVSAVSALFLVASTAHAQTADEIVAKNLAAKGGIEKILAIQAIRTTGTMTGMGPQALTMVSISKRPNLSRQEMTMNGQTIVMAFDGKAARMINPMAGPGVIDVPAEQVEMIKDQSDMDGPLVDYKAKGNTIELVMGWEIQGFASTSTLKGELKGDTFEGKYDSATSEGAAAGTWNAKRK